MKIESKICSSSIFVYTNLHLLEWSVTSFYVREAEGLKIERQRGLKKKLHNFFHLVQCDH